MKLLRRPVMAFVVALETLAAWTREHVLGQPVRYFDSMTITPVTYTDVANRIVRKNPGPLTLHLSAPETWGERQWDGRGVMHYRCRRPRPIQRESSVEETPQTA